MNRQNWEAAGGSDQGNHRTYNEDSFCFRTAMAGGHWAGLMAVADGVGSLGHGAEASRMLVEQILAWWKQELPWLAETGREPGAEVLAEHLEAALREANRKILAYGRSQCFQLATTASVLLLFQGRYLVLHVGDSRIYRVEGKMPHRLRQLTEDQVCQVERTVEGRRVRKSVLTDCLGYRETFRIWRQAGTLEKGDLFLACSDGLYRTWEPEALRRRIWKGRRNLEELSESLIREARLAGETDNISLAVLRIGEPGK